MTKKTKEAIKASAAIVLAILAVLLLWIYPLNQAGKIVVADRTEFQMPDWAGDSIIIDTIAPVTEDNLKLTGYRFQNMNDSLRGTVILLHGLNGGMETQLGKAKALTELGYSAVIYDQRGFGSSDGKYYSGGFFEATDLQAVISRIYLENKLIHPVVVWGEDHGGAAALKIWPREDRIDYVIAENPIVNGHDWMDRIIKAKNLSTPSFMESLVWWWMKQKSAFEININETDISDDIGWAVVNKPESFAIVYCGKPDQPQDKYLAELVDMGGNWLASDCSENGLDDKTFQNLISLFAGAEQSN